MKKTNFTNLKLVKNWLLVVAMIVTTFSATQLSAQCQLNADDHVHVILSDDNCDATLTEDKFLTDDGAACVVAAHYEFEVRSEDGSTVLIPMQEAPVLDHTFIGGPYMLIMQAHNAAHNVLNTAMLTFDVADKMPPTITCPVDPMEIACWQDDATLLVTNDNCSTSTLTWTDEVITANDCSTGLGGLNWPFDRFKQITRTYVATDASGNKSAPCTVTLNVNSFDYWNGISPFPTLNAYIWGVPNLQHSIGTAISCKDADSYKDAEGNFDPNKTGWPEMIHWDENPSNAELLAGDQFDTVAIDNNCTFDCNLASTYIDVKVNTCPNCVERVLRMWTVVETTCDPNNFSQIVHVDAQHIEVYDDIDPIIVCPDNQVITTNTIANFPPSLAGDIDCGAMYTFPVPEMSDDCHPTLTWTIAVVNDMGTPIMFADTTATKTPVSRALPFGLNTVTYTAYDHCGNKAECEWTIDVKDFTAPVAVCQQNTAVSLTYDGEAQIFAPSFDSGSYDDCLIDKFKVRRMDNRFTCDSTDSYGVFRDYVTFCCDDIVDNDITVIMRVYDKGGAYNDCMVQVNVQDKLPPQITCPPSICVECDYSFVLSEMGNYFGNVVQGYDNRESHTIAGNWGAEYDTYKGYCYDNVKDFKFKDGWAHDNCGLEITDDYVDHRDQCNSGNIVRTFRASDPNGTVYCTQTIHFFNPDPFDVNDIDWPSDVTVTGCFNEAAYGPDVTGWPVLTEDNCDLAAANYKDDVFHFNDDNFDAESVCFKVIRHWTVMDWCQRHTSDPLDPEYDPALAGKFYTWPWDQVIMISETEDPVFTSDCEDKETCTYDAACEGGYIELTMSAHDDCTLDDNLKWRYKIDFNNDGSFDKDSKNFLNPIISGPTANASGTYPIGKHRIVWTVWDQCGNRAVCDKFFTVKNCKKPTPRCIDHIVIEMMPVDTDNDGIADWAMIDVDANLVEACCSKSTHPCGYPLMYSFSEDLNDTLRTYNCNDKGLQEVRMYVTALLPDSTTTSDFCITHIDFQDNNNVCPAISSPMIDLAGTVTTVLEEPITDVKMELQGSEITPMNTNDNGEFLFRTIANKNYKLTASKEGNNLSGVTTLDIVLIQKHLLGLKKIDNPFKLLAANVKHDKKLSASDILVLRRLILGDINDIGDTWLFVSKDYNFKNSSKPFNETLATSVDINSSEDVIANFYGIKMGDVNFSLDMLEARSAEKLILTTDNAKVESGQVEVPIYANDFDGINGFQYTVQFDTKSMKYESIESGSLTVNNSNIGSKRVNEGIITMSWNKESDINTSSNEPLFTLKFVATNNVELKNVLAINSNFTKKEAYNANLEVMDVDLQFRSNDSNVFELYQNTPNPFSTFTDINFNLPESSKGSISIYDLTGKVLKVIEADYSKGMNSVRIKKSDLNVSGVLYYRLETENYTSTKKMILIK